MLEVICVTIFCLVLISPTLPLWTALARQLRKRPTFRLGAVFGIVAVFSVTFAMLRTIGSSGFWAADLFFASVAFIWAIGIVCGAITLLEDSLWSRGQRPKRRDVNFTTGPESPPDSEQDSSANGTVARTIEDGDQED